MVTKLLINMPRYFKIHIHHTHIDKLPVTLNDGAHSTNIDYELGIKPNNNTKFSKLASC